MIYAVTKCHSINDPCVTPAGVPVDKTIPAKLLRGFRVSLLNCFTHVRDRAHALLIHNHAQGGTPKSDSSYFFSMPIFFKNGSSDRLRPRNFSMDSFTSRELPGS